MNHTWKIEQLEYNNDEHGGVITAHWRCFSTDGNHTVSRYGSAGFTPNPEDEGFIPLEELSEETVLEWVWESVNKENTENAGASEIEALISPATIKGLPWNTAVETTEVEE
jgi:hypothetical protein